MAREHRHHEREREHRRGRARREELEDERYRGQRDRGYMAGSGRPDVDPDSALSPYGGREFGDPAYQPSESDRWRSRAHGYGDTDYRADRGEPYDPAYRHPLGRESRPDYWTTRRAGHLSGRGGRWPADERAGAEWRNTGNWPQTRSAGRVSEYGYFGEGADRPELTGPPERASLRGMSPGYANLGEDYTGRGPRNYVRSDERIREDICDDLTSDPDCDASDIEIEVKGGDVTLSGSVPARYMKHRAEDIADAAPGVRDVENHVRVHRSGTHGERTGRPDQPSADR